MKMKNFNYRQFLFLCFLCLSSALWGCNEDDGFNMNPMVNFNDVRLTGANEVPANNSEGGGVFNGTYDKGTHVMTFNVAWALGNYQDQTVGMHFHGPATPGTNAPVVIGVTGFANEYTGIYSGKTRPLTKEEEQQLLSGKWYFNVHSTTYPGGELRGNLMPKK